MEYLNKTDELPGGSQELVEYAPVPEGDPESDSGIDWIGLVRRRWWIILLIAAVVYAIGLQPVFFMMEKKYRTVGLIEIAPIIPAIIYRDSESDQPLPNYDGFKNTQAAIIGSDQVLRRVADEIRKLNLSLFKDVPDLYLAIRQMIDKQGILIVPDRQSFLITIEMTTGQSQAEEAQVLINSIINNYMAVAVEGQNREENAKLSILENERKQLLAKMEGQQETVRQLVDEFGTGELTVLQQMQYERLASLQRELTDTEIQLLALDSQIQVLEQGQEAGGLSEVLLEQRNQILQSDPTLQSLGEDLRRHESEILVSRQTMHPNNPVLIRQEQVLQTLQERYEERKGEVLKEFETSFEERQRNARQLKLNELRNQRNQLSVLQKRFQEKMAEQDTETVRLGRKQFTIDDQKEQLRLTKERLQETNRRIEELLVESKRPARISIADRAFSVPAEGKRKKMAAAVGMGGLALGTFVAFLLHKSDKRITDPREVVKRIQVKILGTTTDPNSVKRTLLPQQLSDDYQTIRANLGLLNGQSGPSIILVSSPGVKDGKTTFSINLATSFANSGKKTLLIDADLRKPDVSGALNLPPSLRGFQDYLFGKKLEDCVYRYKESQLYILASDFRNSADALDLLAHPQASGRIQKLKEVFETIIIDSPPVLAFADSLVLARMSDAVILTTFLGHTSQTDIQEAFSRLRQIGANILGTVVNNVKVEQGYRSYGYGYGYGHAYGNQGAEGKSPRKRKRDERTLLITSPEPPETS
jgi:capsular exopolysaccharide synthesis family protein